MKVYKNLFNEVISLENVLRAWDGFRKGKREKFDVQIFEYFLENNLFHLQSELVSKLYQHRPYQQFYIKDPKVRLIHKAAVRDRVVHHLIYQALNPIFEPTFIADSYSCRKNKGTHRAVKRLRVFTEKISKTRGKCFVLKCDIKKFFHSVDHNILFSQISQRIKDSDLLWLIKNVVESFTANMAGTRERERERE